MNEVKKYFQEQISNGATENFFYATELNGEVRIERHRGPIDSLSLEGLVFDRMVASTPFFKVLS